MLGRVAKGEEAAFADLYDALAGAVPALVRKVVRDPAQSEEVDPEDMLDQWRTAAYYGPARGSATTWTELQTAAQDRHAAYDQGVGQAEARFEQRQVRRCMGTLTPVQHEPVTLAYYGGLTYRKVSEQLRLLLRTVKTRRRDSLGASA
ncbi:RNA polymerase subunit sigma [Yinghuangia sp. KLBMP8922]|uniref:RNA polymerase subunit sigma n=1 Tax=Yinghuangia soli TaxID=2908204 RepID=A0AA41U4U1_9ACTN|nr:sigma factor-like helix-turn-helix DNA-binding protein [Yinghuangia soli]MCF2534043.1 RNA polymerase subunit sigma [Yinghuangia soli]